LPWAILVAGILISLVLWTSLSGQSLIAAFIALAGSAMLALLVRQYADLLKKDTQLYASAGELSASQAQTRAHIAHLESIYGVVPVGLCMLDTDQRYVYINERLAGIYNRTVAEHIGRTPREIDSAMADRFEPFLQYVLKTGTPLESVEIAGQSEERTSRTWVCSFHPRGTSPVT